MTQGTSIVKNINEKKNKIQKIGIISGKGGVGKTTLTASLACILNKKFKLITCDCDVDAPNLGLLLKSNKFLKRIKIEGTEKAFFVKENCLNCRNCIISHFCEFESINWDFNNEIPVINQISCEGCGACEILCPQKAFEIKPVISGMVTFEICKYGFYQIWGETVLGATSSGKLVTDMKRFLYNQLENLETELILVDGPPGIGCPVIATVGDLDYVIVIIEPTPTGLHDAKRAIEMLEQMNIDYGVVINKVDVFKEYFPIIEDYIENNNIHVLGKIPIDNKIPLSSIDGLPIVKYDPNSDASKEINEIAENLLKIVDL